MTMSGGFCGEPRGSVSIVISGSRDLLLHQVIADLPLPRKICDGGSTLGSLLGSTYPAPLLVAVYRSSSP
jgi:hypothetical protein